MRNFFIAILATGFIAGCTTVPVSENRTTHFRGNENCSGELIQQSLTNASNMAQINIGMEKQRAFSIMGIPQKYESFALEDDRVLEAMFYRTGSEDCYSATDAEPFTPLIFKDGVLIGFGADYYRVMVAPALRKPAPVPEAAPAPQPQPVPQQMPYQPYQYQYPYGYPQGYVPYGY